MTRVEFLMLRQSVKNYNYNINRQEIINLDDREFSIEEFRDNDYIIVNVFDFDTNELCFVMSKKIDENWFLVDPDSLKDGWWKEKVDLYGLVDAMTK